MDAMSASFSGEKCNGNGDVSRRQQWSRIYYVNDDYFNDNSNLVFVNMQSDSLHIQVDQNSKASERQRKKNNRKSKIFYVNCEHINMGYDTKNTPSSSDESVKFCPSNPNGICNNAEHDMNIINGEMKPVYISKSLSESYSSDEQVSSMGSIPGRDTPTSGRSTPSFRKKPKRPDIKISDHHVYRDFVEIRRTDSLTSLDSEMDRYSFISDGSFIDIPYYSETPSEEMNGHVVSERLADVHELEETLRDDTPIPLNSVDVKYNNVKKICRERPDSPTSLLLLPVFMSNNADPMTALHERLSPLLNRLRTLEEECKLMTSLKTKVAVLEEEKKQLEEHQMLQQSTLVEFSSCDKETITDNTNYPSAQVSAAQTQTLIECINNAVQCDSVENPELYQDIGIQSTPDIKDCGVQKYLELFTEISHKGTLTDKVSVKSTGIGDNIADIAQTDSCSQCSVEQNEFSCQNNILLSINDKCTETIQHPSLDKSIGDGVAEIIFKSTGVQQCPIQKHCSTQSDKCSLKDSETMFGTPVSCLADRAVGDEIAEIIYSNRDTQTLKNAHKNASTQSVIESNDKSVSSGCSYSSLKSSSVQHSPSVDDFACGENFAEIITEEKASSNVPILRDSCVATDIVEMVDSSVECNIVNDTVSKGVGDDTITDIFCEKCLVTRSDIAVGTYENSQPCKTDDKLCDCVQPETNSIGVGDTSIDKINCDKCENLQTVSLGVGDCKVDDLLCDKCVCKQDENYMISIGIGDADVNDTTCDKCNSKDDNDNMFNFDLNILNSRSTSATPQQAVLCHYCGNKVDLNDTNLDDSLQSMRDNMKSISCGMKRTTASKNLNIEYESEVRPQSQASEDDVVVSDDDYEEENTSCRNDVIEACKMLHDHFSGQKPLKQPVMMKYVGIIQALWFKTVKRRRANASVVKSYIDLFQQRIPELLEMIVNLSDDEGNTALHYALTYKNLGVVSILLDSGECCVDLANQAGYSPIMLAALAGFEKKNDKYIMQRLFRLGNINKEASENGQTPLMLAVSRGNIGIIEILLDAGCDVNATDDEGSTSLMCACEHGNINIVKMLLSHPGCDATIEDNEGSTALSIAMDARRKDLALLVYGSLNFDARGRIKLSPSKQSLLGLGRRSPSPVIGRR